MVIYYLEGFLSKGFIRKQHKDISIFALMFGIKDTEFIMKYGIYGEHACNRDVINASGNTYKTRYNYQFLQP